jgi:translation initiation factor 1
MSQNKNYRLVYSTDGSHKNLCKKCGLNPCQCRLAQTVKPAEVTAKIRLEKKGRGGKAVSVIFNLPHNPDYFTKLCKTLKSQCGSGGTFKDDQIEIQGDHRDKLKQLLEKMGFQVKLAGG